MTTFIFFILFAITQLSLAIPYYSEKCREEFEHIQHNELDNQYIRQLHSDGNNVQSIITPLNIPSSTETNKNTDVNINLPVSQPLPNKFLAYSEWWEVITEYAPNGEKRTYLRLGPMPRMPFYNSIKSHINHDYDNNRATVDTTKYEPPHLDNHHNHKTFVLEPENTSVYLKKNILPVQLTSRHSKQTVSLDKSPKFKSHKDKTNEETVDSDIETRRKSHDNVNSNSNTNINARRSSSKDEGAVQPDPRKSGNSNKNINVNDRKGGGIDSTLLKLYQNLGRESTNSEESAESGGKSLGRSAPPMGARSHSNVNHNVNANINSDMAVGVGVLGAEDLVRRNLNNKKRHPSKSHHSNDNRNVNININTDDNEPMDDVQEEPVDNAVEGDDDNAVN